jgi:phage gpG-like protein
MADFSVKIEFDTSAFERRFSPERLRRAGGVAITAVGVRVLEHTREGFVVGGWNPETGDPGFWPKKKIPDGGGSAQDSKGNKRRARGQKPGAKQRSGNILYDTGRYFNSINLQITKGENPEAVIGTNVEYAKYHEQPGNDAGFTQQKATSKQAGFLRALGYAGVQKGSTITLPQRRVFVMPKPLQDEIKAIYADEFVADLEAA